MRRHDWSERFHMLSIDGVASTLTPALERGQSKGFLSPPQSVHACSSTNCLWSPLVGQIIVRFAVPFLGSHLRGLFAPCHCLLMSTPHASWVHSGYKSTCADSSREARVRLLVAASTMLDLRGSGAMTSGNSRTEPSRKFGRGALGEFASSLARLNVAAHVAQQRHPTPT